VGQSESDVPGGGPRLVTGSVRVSLRGPHEAHIDHLFDEGYITFSSSQELVIVPEVRDKLLDAWGIDAGVRVGEFTREQNAYSTITV